MYLVHVAVDVADGEAAIDALRQTLSTSAAKIDGLQHTYIEAAEDQIVFSLYLHVVDQRSAFNVADELCRRTMASLRPARQWSISWIRAGL